LLIPKAPVLGDPKGSLPPAAASYLLLRRLTIILSVRLLLRVL
jgi:hypothetical protein